MSKIYLLENVYDAAIRRMEFVRDNFDRVVVAFSGGKDSTVAMHLTMEVFQKPVVYFWDKESNLITTANFVRDTFDTQEIEPYWFCLPFNMRNALSVYEPYWVCWDPACPEKWVYQVPERDYVITTENNFLKNYTPEKHNLYRLFAEHISEDGKYRTAVVVGLRTDESLNRFRAVTKNPQLGQTWITKTDADNCYNVYPIYDWSFGDVWTYISTNNIRYNPVYDMMFKAGLYKRNIRISQSFCDVSKQGIPIIREIDPESYNRFLQRVAGVNSLTHVNLSDVLAQATNGVDYDFLMQLYPESVRSGIQKKIERSQSLDPRDPHVVKALLNNDIRLKRVNRSRKPGAKEKYADL